MSNSAARGTLSENVPDLSLGIRNFDASPSADWRHIFDQARAADDAGIARVFVGDHLLFGADLGAYADPRSGGVEGGVQPTGPDGDWLEPLTVLAALAGVTKRVRLATNILIAPLRNPVVLAKTAATLDVLSAGRLELGVGIGWQKAEYQAVGADYRSRGQILDETLAACRELWTTAEASFAGKHLSFTEVHMMPKPATAGGIPVWVSGRPIPAVARRLARFGTGWLPWGVTPTSVTGDLGRMRDLVETLGRKWDTVKVAYGLRAMSKASGRLDLSRMFEQVSELWELGVTDFRVVLRLPPEYADARNLLEHVHERFLETCNGR